MIWLFALAVVLVVVAIIAAHDRHPIDWDKEEKDYHINHFKKINHD